jgi:hypothetical protein
MSETELVMAKKIMTRHGSISFTAVMLELCLENPFICLGSDITWL